MQIMHVLPAQVMAREREQRRVDGCPGEEDAKVQPDARVQVEEDLPAALDDGVQGPGVAPVVEARFEVDCVGVR